MKFRLKFPIEVAGTGKVSVLELRTRITVGDLLFANKEGAGDSLAQDVALKSRLTGLLPEDLHGMDTEDYERLGEVIAEAKKLKAQASSDLPTT